MLQEWWPRRVLAAILTLFQPAGAKGGGQIMPTILMSSPSLAADRVQFLVWKNTFSYFSDWLCIHTRPHLNGSCFT